MNSIKCLLFWAYNICSSYLSFHIELTFLTSYFSNNTVSNQIKKFLHKQYSCIPKLPTVSKEIIYLKLSYCDNESFYIRNRVKRLLSKFYPHLHIRFIFINNFRIGSLFNIKDKMPVNVRSSVVYEYRCNCNDTYIGKTERHLCFSLCTCRYFLLHRQALTSPSHSAIRDHCLAAGHVFHSNNFSILNTNKNPFELCILESILIKKHNPSLNNRHQLN